MFFGVMNYNRCQNAITPFFKTISEVWSYVTQFKPSEYFSDNLSVGFDRDRVSLYFINHIGDIVQLEDVFEGED